jgi:hypothetical protein
VGDEFGSGSIRSGFADPGEKQPPAVLPGLEYANSRHEAKSLIKYQVKLFPD